jgi:REP element-mobilizing transposase RayT
MRPLRFIPPGSVVEVTMRTLQGRLLLRPGVAVNDAILGILGLAQMRYGMTIHYVVAMSNHIHLLLRPRDARQLARFMCFVNSNIAREVGRLVGWQQRFWSGRYHAIVVSDEEEAQLSRLRYLLSQGVKENLVAHPFDWPGVSCARALTTGEPLAGNWLDRAELYRSPQRRKGGEKPPDAVQFRKIYSVELEPIPCLAPCDLEQRRALILDLIAELVTSAAALRGSQGIRVLGRKAVVRLRPRSVPKVSHSPAPLFHAFRSEVGRRLREAYALFVAAFREAASRLKLGVQEVKFPEGSFPPAMPFVAHGAAGR